MKKSHKRLKRAALLEVLRFRKDGGSREHALKLARFIYRKTCQEIQAELKQERR